MEPFIHYVICPECGRPNNERRHACLACDTKLVSEDEAGHTRYITHLRRERWRLLLVTSALSAGFLAALLLALLPLFGVRNRPTWIVYAGLVLLGIGAGKKIGQYLNVQRFLRSLPR